MKLHKDDIDALTEVINIGVGKAANSLNEIMEHHVSLQVPRVEIISEDDFKFNDHIMVEESISSIHQKFDGEFSGSASLFFPETSAKNLVSNVTGDEMLSEDMDSIRSSTLLEIGNIVINAILGTITNLLKSSVNFYLPEYHGGREIRKVVLSAIPPKNSKVIVKAETVFNLKELEITGFILLIFEVKAIEQLIKMIEIYINE